MVGGGALRDRGRPSAVGSAGLALIGTALACATVVHVLMLLVEYGGRHATAGRPRWPPT